MMLPNSTPKAARSAVIELLLVSGLWNDSEVTRCSVIGMRGYYLVEGVA